jgi:hypothetical protein
MIHKRHLTIWRKATTLQTSLSCEIEQDPPGKAGERWSIAGRCHPIAIANTRYGTSAHSSERATLTSGRHYVAKSI